MARLRAALFAMAAAFPAVANGQAVPEVFPVGEIEIGLTVVPFSTDDLIRVDSEDISGGVSIIVTLADRLGPELVNATLAKTGYPVALNLCGRRVIEATLQGELTSAVLAFTLDDPARAAQVVGQLRKPPCAEV